MSKDKEERLHKPKDSSNKNLPLYASDKIIIKLKRDTSLRLTTAIPSMPVKYTTSAVKDFGHSSLDKIAKEVGVVSIRSIGRLTQLPHDPLLDSVLASSSAAVSGFNELSNTFVLGIAESTDLDVALSKFKRLDEVVDTSYDFLRYTSLLPNDPSYFEQWGLSQINCLEAWDRINEGNATVAVVDTGVQRNHPDLRDNILRGYDFVDINPDTMELDPGYTFVGDVRRRDGVPADDNGHGTHVAGTIAAVTNNGRGVAGVAWGCAKILPVRVMVSIKTPEGDILGSGTDSDITTGIRWAADNAVDAINLSLGGPENSFVWRDAISYAYGKNCAIVAAMGNEFREGNPTSYPAAYPNVLAVGAVDESGLRASFSNTGPHIDVVAPGVRILSTYIGGNYASLNGTSMATPHVTGLAAMLKANNRHLSNAQVYNIIRNSARELGGTPFNQEYGHGIIDAQAALSISPSPAIPVLESGQRIKQCPDGSHKTEQYSCEERLHSIEKKLQEALDCIRLLRK